MAEIRALVTRPQGQAEGLLAEIARNGGFALHYPVMAITELDASAEKPRYQHCKQLMMALDEYQHVIFISGNAVNFGMEWIHQYWPQLPIGIFWYGIGQSTREKMHNQGLPVEAFSAKANTVNARQAMISEELLTHEKLQQIDQQNIMIVRGVGGRDYLAQQLTERGAKVSYVECYQRAVVARPIGEIAQAIEENSINSVLVNSGESLENLCLLAGPEFSHKLKKLLLIVPSERVLSLAKEQGFEKIILADNASDDAMLSALKNYQP